MLASLGFLLEHQPPGLPMVLASRVGPPLAAAESSMALPDGAVTALADRTEEWVAGL